MWKMWKTKRTTPVKSRVLVKNTEVFHRRDCGECGKLNLSFSVLLMQNRRFYNKKHFSHPSEYCPFFSVLKRVYFVRKVYAVLHIRLSDCLVFSASRALCPVRARAFSLRLLHRGDPPPSGCVQHPLRIRASACFVFFACPQNSAGAVRHCDLAYLCYARPCDALHSFAEASCKPCFFRLYQRRGARGNPPLCRSDPRVLQGEVPRARDLHSPGAYTEEARAEAAFRDNRWLHIRACLSSDGYPCNT